MLARKIKVLDNYKYIWNVKFSNDSNLHCEKIYKDTQGKKSICGFVLASTLLFGYKIKFESAVQMVKLWYEEIQKKYKIHKTQKINFHICKSGNKQTIQEVSFHKCMVIPFGSWEGSFPRTSPGFTWQWPFIFFLFVYFFIVNDFIYFSFFFFFLFVVDFVIHWNETSMGLHVFPIPIPPPTSLSTRSL